MNFILTRGLMTSLIVGTILVLINNYDSILSQNWDSISLFKIILTYLVPFFVSTYSSYMTKKSTLKEIHREKKKFTFEDT